MGHKLLLLTKANQQYRDLIEAQKLPDLEILDDNPAGIIEADIWLAEPKLAAPLLPHAKNLQWLQSSFAGIDALMSLRGRKDYQLTNIKGIFGPLMSEYLFGYLLAHIRGHGFYRQQQQQKQWQVQPPHTSHKFTRNAIALARYWLNCPASREDGKALWHACHRH